MSVSATVRLELSWQGDLSYKEKGQMTSVEVMLGHSKDFSLHLSAPVDQQFSSEKRQTLFFTAEHQGSAYLKKEKKCSYRQFECPLHLVKEISLSAKICPLNQVASKRPRITYVLLEFCEFPELKPNGLYQIQIAHQNNYLKAVLAKKTQDAVAPYL